MSMSTFYLKKRDTRPTMEVELLDPDGTAHDLTGAASVWCHVYLSNGSLLSRQMTIDPDPTTGIVRYTWLVTDWSAPAGVVLVGGSHRMEFEVKGILNEARLTFPNSGYDTLRCMDDLGQA